ncbi:hypothetical protein HOH30_00245 [Candidatus Woesearchaeota archaeon]|nr:hypothetical protein [Candidatus Woesearchaeota archaeon]
MKNANLCYNEVWGTKDNFMVLNFFLEMQKFRNRLTFPQVIEILELFLSKLNPISQKVLYMKISVLFDFVDTDNQRLLDKVRVAIVDVQDYTDDEFYERVEFYKSLFKMAEETLPSNQNSPNGWLDRMKNLTECVAELRNKTFLESAFEDEDFEKFYDDEDYIVAYRGFCCEGNHRIRLGDAVKQEKDKDFDYEVLPDEYKEQLSEYQNMGKGVSYSLDKNVALTFAFRSRNKLLTLAPEGTNVRAVVGKYLIKKKDIFAYANGRSEREIVVISNSENTIKTSSFPSLKHYEFFTNTDGHFDKTGMDCEPQFRNKENESMYDYAKKYKDTKIERVLN